MKLGDGVEAAIHCTALLAGLEGDAVLPGAALAEYHGVSPTYLVKHLKALVGAGLLQSVPGPAGGYRLACLPEKITLLDIVLAVEGSKPAFRCGEIRQRGPGAPDASAFVRPCGIASAMLRAEAAWRNALSTTTLADIVADFQATGDPRSVARGCAYLEANQRRQPQP